MTAVLPVLPPDTVPVPEAQRDWPFHSNGYRRRMLVRAMFAAKGRTCHLCGLPGATTADHVIPWVHGGRNTVENLAPAHYGCNYSRRDMTLRQWFAAHPLRTATALPPSREW